MNNGIRNGCDDMTIKMFNEGNASMTAQLGGKGANLAEMVQLGLPIPFGFTISTEVCAMYETAHDLPVEIKDTIIKSLRNLEAHTQQTFGDASNPLLVSVRSGAAVSMPGMMDTILNLGLNDVITESLAQKDAVFAYDLYRRFIQMFGNVVKEIDMSLFDTAYDAHFDGSASSLKQIVDAYKVIYETETGTAFSQDPMVHLFEAIEAVFASWNNPRAIYYRNVNHITHLKGTAVNVQQMVFGNKDHQSATGVCFTRNPATGVKELFGEILWDAQGEDIVAGTHTPLPISDLKDKHPTLYHQLTETAKTLELHYKDMQDIEFTIESGTLYLLQTRNGKRTPGAALRILLDLVNEGVITEQEAIQKVSLDDISAALHTAFDPVIQKQATAIGKGLPASPGAAVGAIAFSTATALKLKEQGLNSILVRAETSPDDIEGMHCAQAILTSKGGMTSHAAVVTRGMGKPCIVGSKDVVFTESGALTIGGISFTEGDVISLDGGLGLIYEGALALDTKQSNSDLDALLNIALKYQTMDIQVNADTPVDIDTALSFHAKGIGLVRTEHMFFEHARIQAVREMILSTTEAGRQRALEKLIPFQRADFKAIFEHIKGHPTTVRYLDPPLHEFMPTERKDIAELAVSMNVSEETLDTTIHALHEFNPMMGHRGSRLAVTYPEIYLMQTQAIVEAAIAAEQEHPSLKNHINLMLPLIGDVNELKFLHEKIAALIETLTTEHNHPLNIQIGTMIELPRACLLAHEIATFSDFISFGTNDLTQMTYGFSRDDIHHFIHDYYDKNIYQQDPFATIDQVAVGELLKIAIERARSVKPDMKIGVCGEHGGDPASIIFFKSIGMDYLSCSPYRVPVAVVASAKLAFDQRH